MRQTFKLKLKYTQGTYLKEGSGVEWRRGQSILAKVYSLFPKIALR